MGDSGETSHLSFWVERKHIVKNLENRTDPILLCLNKFPSRKNSYLKSKPILEQINKDNTHFSWAKEVIGLKVQETLFLVQMTTKAWFLIKPSLD